MINKLRVLKSVSFLSFICFSLTGVSQKNVDTTKHVVNNNRLNHSATGTVIRVDNKNCPIAIRVVGPTKNDTTFMLPIGNAVDTLIGSNISFNYGRLMIKQPMGCIGMPVRLWNIQRVPEKTHRKSKKKRSK